MVFYGRLRLSWLYLKNESTIGLAWGLGQCSQPKSDPWAEYDMAFLGPAGRLGKRLQSSNGCVMGDVSASLWVQVMMIRR